MTSIVSREILAQLAEPLSASDVEWRVGSTTQDKKKGQGVPYLTFEACARHLDTVVGMENWSVEYKAGPSGGVICRLGVRVNGEWVYKENGAENTDIESVKGGLTDAFKRACAMWGIGRYLYRYEPRWVDLDDKKRLAASPKLPDWALPERERGGQAKPAQASASQPATAAKDRPSAAAAPEQAKPAAAPANEPAAASTAVSHDADGLPAGLDEKAKKTVQDLLLKMEKIPAKMIENYLDGEKAKTVLGDAGVSFVRARLNEKTKAAAVA